jgi:queuine tRNA-ribosyltransferase
MKQVTFSLLATDGMARHGRIDTTRGEINTPAFMPVGTAGTVKAMYPEQVRETGADVLLGNTYHLMLRPGAERVASLGGLHTFMNWERPILTDSGGFQVMSLAKLRKLTEKGVTFKSHIDGSSHELTPERSIEIQTLLDSDIIMQLDECIALPAERKEIERAMELSIRWADRSKTAFNNQQNRALFGIVQGGDDAELRARSAAGLKSIGFDGYSIGGLAVGEPQEVMFRVLVRHNAGTADRSPALLDGRRQAGRYSGRYRAGRRHVRLRASHPRRAPWPCLYALRRHQPEERPA